MNPMKFIAELPEEEMTPTVSKLIGFIQQQAEELQALKDEISRLKGQKTKPKIKPSNLDKDTEQSGVNHGCCRNYAANFSVRLFQKSSHQPFALNMRKASIGFMESAFQLAPGIFSRFWGIDL